MVEKVRAGLAAEKNSASGALSLREKHSGTKNFRVAGSRKFKCRCFSRAFQRKSFSVTRLGAEFRNCLSNLKVAKGE